MYYNRIQPGLQPVFPNIFTWALILPSLMRAGWICYKKTAAAAAHNVCINRGSGTLHSLIYKIFPSIKILSSAQFLPLAYYTGSPITRIPAAPEATWTG